MQVNDPKTTKFKVKNQIRARQKKVIEPNVGDAELMKDELRSRKSKLIGQSGA